MKEKFDKRLILASKSPRRYELLSPYFDSVKVVVADIEEKYFQTLPQEIVKELARLKLTGITEKYPNDFVISGDTIVWYNGKVFGKPKDEDDAFNMLKELSGKCHSVYSGFAVSYKGRVVVGEDRCDVYFKLLSDKEINDYIATRSPMDKAGSYGIQDGVVVERFTGDVNTIIGLPLDKILKVCEELLNE